MPSVKYTALANITLSTTASSVNFGSIPSTYRDLYLVMSGTVSGVGGLRFRVNSDSGASYAYVEMRGNKSGGTDAARSTYGTSQISVIATESSLNTGSRFETHLELLEYKATDKDKPFLSLTSYTDDAANTVIEQTGAKWGGASAITSLSVFMSSSTFAAGTTMCLYGVK